MSKLEAGKREAEAIQAVILAWQEANGVTALGALHRVSLAHAILCARAAPSALGSDDAYFDVYALGVGHVLTDQDVADIQKVLADYNEELESRVEAYEQARTAGLHALGGDELVNAVHAKDEATTKAIIDRALERFWAAHGSATGGGS